MPKHIREHKCLASAWSCLGPLGKAATATEISKGLVNLADLNLPSLALADLSSLLACMRLLTLSETATQLGVSTDSVRRLADSGKIVAIRPLGPNGHRRVVADSVDDYLAQLVEGASVGVPGASYAKPQPVYFDISAIIAKGKKLSKVARKTS